MTTRPELDRAAAFSLAAYLVDLAARGRVLWIGSPLGAASLAQVAEYVRVLEPGLSDSGRRRRRRGGSLDTRAFMPGALSLGDAPYDLIAVPDVAVFADSLGEHVSTLMSRLSEQGALVLGLEPEESSQRATIEACLALGGREMRLLGLAAFSGQVIADLGKEPEEILVDSSLIREAPAPRRLFAISVAPGRAPADYLVVQHPAPLREPSRQPEVPAPAPAADARLEQELEAANAHGEALERAVAERSQQIEALRSEVADRGRELEQERLALAECRSLSVRAPGATSVSAREVSAREEHAALEGALLERGRRVRALEREIERIERLCRDAIERLRARPPVPIGELERAVERAVEAEAAQSEAIFRIDELESRLAAGAGAGLEAGVGAGPEPALVPTLEGRARGLMARLCEVEEMLGQAEARAMIAEVDLLEAEERYRALQRERAELAEHYEMALVRVHGGEAAAAARLEADLEAQLQALRESEGELSAQVGVLGGQLVLRSEQLAEIGAERDRARAEAMGLIARVASLETQLEGLRLGYETRLALQRAESAPSASAASLPRPSAGEAGLEVERDALRGERAGLRLRLADREAAVRALQLRMLPLEAAAPGSEEPSVHERLAQTVSELETLRATASAQLIRLSDLDRERDEIQTRARALQGSLAARDALLTRLQLDLADAEQVERGHLAVQERLERERDRLQRAVVEASIAADEAGEALRAEATSARAETERSQEICGRLREELELARNAASETALTKGALEAEIAQLRRWAQDAGSEQERLVKAHEESRRLLRNAREALSLVADLG
ncbi:MAG: hypothetical protein OEY14_05955, partial [Myxococcales bacterium]|nr:hypothetical protein [Myxococcales bacterium]